MNELQTDNAVRACRAAIWIAMLEAERAMWLDVRDNLYELHAVVDDRVRRQGPNQPEREI